VARAGRREPFAALIDPDHPSFFAPATAARIAASAPGPGGPRKPPKDEGAFTRCAWRAWRSKYRWTIERLEALLGTTIRSIHVVGGGSRNALLCQFTADACADRLRRPDRGHRRG